MALRADSYTPDMAALIDRDEEIIADDYGVDLATAKRILADRADAARRGQAEILATVIALLMGSRNMPVMVHSLAIAFGMDQLNGAHSQSEIARKLGVTRALISHYVLGWRDILAGGVGAFDNRTFRKRNATRKTYAICATDPVLEARRARPMRSAPPIQFLKPDETNEKNEPDKSHHVRR